MRRATRTLSMRSLLAPLIALSLSGCVGLGPAHIGAVKLAAGDGAITIGSFSFPESVLLAEIYAQALGSKGFRVKRAFDLGPRELVEPALERGLVEFVPEYLGSSLELLTRGSAPVSSDPQTTRARLVDAFNGRGIAVLGSAPAEDANAIVVTAQTAAELHLEKISDLFPVAGQLVFGGPPECPSRPLCLPGLERTYGLHFKRFQGLDASGPLTVSELEAGEIDVALLFTTDGEIRARGFVELADDRGLQPAENVTPVVRGDVIAEYGGRLRLVVDAVSARLNTEALAHLNGLVSRGETPADVALAWLRSNGLVPR